MYVPHHFSSDNKAAEIAFMQRYNFAALVTQVAGEPFATHLPFVVDVSDGHLKLVAHMAKANPQWKSLESQTALVIFAEPHAYISPSLYEKELNVPTWNYIAVHAYGRAQLVSEEKAAFELLEKQMQSFEGEYLIQWNRLPQEYKNGLLKGVVAFEIPVDKLESKWKLNQNKTQQDRENVMVHLSNSEDGNARAISEHMKSFYQK